MNKIIRNIYLWLFVVLVVGCTTDDLASSEQLGQGDATVTLSFDMPNSFEALTRASVESQQAIKGTPLILLMEKGKFVEFATPTMKSNEIAQIKIEKELSLRVDQFIIIANYGAKPSDDHYFMPEVGDTKEKLVEGYKFTNPIDPEKTGIPMWGEVLYDRSKTALNVELERAVALINVKVKSNILGFELKNAYICNYNEYGYYLENKEQAASIKDRVAHSAPYKVTQGVLNNQIFISEVDMSNLKKDEKPTVLVLEGVYNGQAGFYRVDFLKDKEKGEYYSINRNYKYEFTINSISGKGWLTLEQAVANKPSNVIDVTLLQWIADMTQMWEHDGNYMAVGKTELSYSVLTSASNPERFVCQTNINAKENFLFTMPNGDLLDFDIVQGEEDVVYIDFYPKAGVSLEGIDQFNGVLTTTNAAFKFDLNFKRATNYLKVYDVDADLHGKYEYDVMIDPESDDHYMDIKIEYQVKKPITLKVRTGDNMGIDFGFEGVVSLTPNQTITTARLKAYGTPNWKGANQIKLVFGDLHTDSPIRSFDIDVYALEEGENRGIKVLFVTKNGADNGAIYSLINDGKLFGPQGRYIKSKREFDVSYSDHFPLDSYMDYHIIYYFDSATPIDYETYTGEVKNNKSFNLFIEAVKKFLAAGKTFYYTSDRRDVSIYDLDPLRDIERIGANTVEESRHFLQKVTERSLEITVLSQDIKVKSSGFHKEANAYLYPSIRAKEKGMELSYETTLSVINVTLAALVLKHNDPAVRTGFDTRWYLNVYEGGVLGAMGKDVRYPIIAQSNRRGLNQEKLKNMVWIGSQRAFSEATWIKSNNQPTEELDANAKEFCELIKWGVNEVDENDIDFNRPNKKKTFDKEDDKSGYSISITYD